MMLCARMDWSLLGKELIEQAARRRTYLMRAGYAALLFGGFVWYYEQSLPREASQMFGRGLDVFQFLVGTQVIAVYLFQPLLMAGAIAREKERETLPLLFLTDLRPQDLIRQKYVAGVMPMLTFLLLSLPLMAVAYSLGGVSFHTLWVSIVLLFITCFEVGALALMCSAYAATTFQALVRSYLFAVGTLFLCGTPISTGSRRGLGYELLHLVIAFVLMREFLKRARKHLVARAYVPRQNPFQQQFKQMDRFWRDSRKVVRGILWAKDDSTFSAATQVVQAHRGRVTTETRRSLFRFLMNRLQVPGLLAAAIILGSLAAPFLLGGVLFGGLASSVVPALVFFLWGIALLTVPIQSANAIASERMNQRLDVLLTTPLSAAEILQQRTIAVRRWIRFLTWPMAGVFLLGAWARWRGEDGQAQKLEAFLYLIESGLSVLLYFRLMHWLSLTIGLKVRHQLRSLLTAFVAMLAWCILPGAIGDALESVRRPILPELLSVVSPWRMIYSTQTLRAGLFAVIFGFGFSGALWWLVRWHCLRNADRYLGRI